MRRLPCRARTHPLLALCLGFLPATALAQTAPAPGDIVVTAQRRPESILKTPLAISAFSADFVERTKLDDVKDLVTFTPGFSGNSDDSFIDGLAVRGIVSNDYGIGGDPSIGIFKDGVYQGRTGSVVTSLFDIERAEALRGPQGFLFGRNAISGAISVITTKPELGRTSGHVFATLGETKRAEFEAAINLPLGDHWALRVAGFRARSDGWVDNAFTPGVNDRVMGEKKLAARASLLFDNGPLRVVITGERERRRLDGTPYRASNADTEVLDYLGEALGRPVVIRGDRRDVDTDLVDPRDDGTIASVNMQADLELDFATLTSISAYRHHRFFYSEDYDGTPLLLGNYAQKQRGSYASQELRLVSASGERLTWSAGLSGYRENVRARFTNEADDRAVCLAGYGYASCDELTEDLYGAAYTPSPGGVLIDVNDARSVNTGVSAYGELNYQLRPKLQIGAGARYTRDHKKFGLNILPSDSSLGSIWTFGYFTDGFIEAAKTWQGLTPRIFARYQATDDLSVYASVTRGYKAGGFGTFTVDAPTPVDDYAVVPAGSRPDAFAPETLWSKEIGVKGWLLDRIVKFDLAAFHYVYRNLQTNYFDTETRTQQVINVGRVTGYGVEATTTLRPSRYFDVLASLAYTHTTKRGERDCLLRDCGGLANPTWASSGVATAHLPTGTGEAYLSGEWSFEGRRRETFDWRGITRRGAYTEINLRLGYKAGARWEANLYVQNLLDADIYRGAENGGDLTPATNWGVAQPRNFGVDIRLRFGS
jgi:iron complex outermembrane receptor protein